MIRPRCVLDRLRSSPLRRAWIVVVVLAGLVAGLHVASHIGGAFASVAHSTPAPGGGSGDGHHDDCPLYRLAGSSTSALSPALWLALLLAWLGLVVSFAPSAQRCTADATLRWCQQRKHGPPSFSR